MKSFLRRVRNRTAGIFFKKNDIKENIISPGSRDELILNDVIQKNLMVSYRVASKDPDSLFSFSDVGFRMYSQHDEDGIILFIFSLIGTLNKKCVEICAGDGIECNTANLIIHHRWIGLLVDGNQVNTDTGTAFYRENKNTKYWPPRITNAWITRDNVNDIISGNGFRDDIDLLSLDIDGNDYWIWESINIIKPRLVVLEFNHLAGPDRSVTVPYDEKFVAEFTAYGSDYAGASLAAFVKLGMKKGYRLIGTNRISTNAFFLRNDIVHPWLPEISAQDCFSHPRAQFGINVRWKGVENKTWQSV